MSKFIEIIKHEKIQLAFTLGCCIILLAYVSKRILHTEISAIVLAIPGFVVIAFESMRKLKNDNNRIKTIYGHIAILVSTLIVILVHL